MGPSGPEVCSPPAAERINTPECTLHATTAAAALQTSTAVHLARPAVGAAVVGVAAGAASRVETGGLPTATYASGAEVSAQGAAASGSAAPAQPLPATATAAAQPVSAPPGAARAPADGHPPDAESMPANDPAASVYNKSASASSTHMGPALAAGGGASAAAPADADKAARAAAEPSPLAQSLDAIPAARLPAVVTLPPAIAAALSAAAAAAGAAAGGPASAGGASAGPEAAQAEPADDLPPDDLAAYLADNPDEEEGDVQLVEEGEDEQVACVVGEEVRAAAGGGGGGGGGQGGDDAGAGVVDYDEGDERHAVALAHLAALREYIEALGGSLAGYRCEVRQRRNGESRGQWDAYYFSPSGERLRSKLEVARSQGLEPADAPRSAGGRDARVLKELPFRQPKSEGAEWTQAPKRKRSGWSAGWAGSGEGGTPRACGPARCSSARAEELVIPDHVPLLIPVRCNGRPGQLAMRDKEVACACTVCGAGGAGGGGEGKKFTCAQWEAHCGKGTCRKWNASVRVVREDVDDLPEGFDDISIRKYMLLKGVDIKAPHPPPPALQPAAQPPSGMPPADALATWLAQGPHFDGAQQPGSAHPEVSGAADGSAARAAPGAHAGPAQPAEKLANQAAPDRSTGAEAPRLHADSAADDSALAVHQQPTGPSCRELAVGPAAAPMDVDGAHGAGERSDAGSGGSSGSGSRAHQDLSAERSAGAATELPEEEVFRAASLAVNHTGAPTGTAFAAATAKMAAAQQPPAADGAQRRVADSRAACPASAAELRQRVQGGAGSADRVPAGEHGNAACAQPSPQCTPAASPAGPTAQPGTGAAAESPPMPQPTAEIRADFAQHDNAVLFRQREAEVARSRGAADSRAGLGRAAAAQNGKTTERPPGNAGHPHKRRRCSEEAPRAGVEVSALLEGVLADLRSDKAAARARIAALEAELSQRAAELSQRAGQLCELGARVAELGAHLAAKDNQLAQLGAQLAQRDAQLAQKDAQLARKDAQLAQRDAQLAQKDAELAQGAAQLAQRDAQLEERSSQLAGKDVQLQAALRGIRLAPQEAELPRAGG